MIEKEKREMTAWKTGRTLFIYLFACDDFEKKKIFLSEMARGFLCAAKLDDVAKRKQN